MFFQIFTHGLFCGSFGHGCVIGNADKYFFVLVGNSTINFHDRDNTADTLCDKTFARTYALHHRGGFLWFKLFVSNGILDKSGTSV